MNWKEQLARYFNESYEYILPQEAINKGTDWYSEFIEIEIIEKLIEDIPDDVGYIVRSPDPHVPPMNVPLKQQLRDKWLGKETAP